MMKKIFVLFFMSILLLPIFALASESEPYESYIDMSTGSSTDPYGTIKADPVTMWSSKS